MLKKYLIGALVFFAFNSSGQNSVARQWNEQLLEAIRDDFARPTVHARNLFHSAVVVYDAWAAYDATSSTYFLGKTVDGFMVPFMGTPQSVDVVEDRNEAISYASYRLLSHRFRNSPGASESIFRFDSLMLELGYDKDFVSEDYANEGAAALGNYLGNQMIQFGQQDGSNEQNDYANLFYNSVNDPLVPDLAGNPNLDSVNRWQPLALETFIDQSGNVFPINTPPFLSPEWGSVSPFSLDQDDATVYNRDGFDYEVFHDPGAPAYLQSDTGLLDYYKWNFALVTTWSSHLDTADEVIWDISPASIGNVLSYPTTESSMRDFYDILEGGDPGEGYDLNPVTGQPYPQQLVRRGDYARVLAEFWADGPDSETPPGHWFSILNYVNDHPLFEKRFGGEGGILDDLEWDVKAYFALGGAMHDAAITAWGCKGWYDYLRPISALRYMADQGQSSDSSLSNYDVFGVPLINGLIETVDSSDVLAGTAKQHVGKIKFKAWRGPDYINDPEIDMAGVNWVLAERWWPYQRPTFVTPPFAGYVSGHSTYSRAAAEVLTRLSGDEYFPGGVGEFIARKNEFLVFEQGPSTDVVLQWAKYKDASDQCSLSRIWGGIHPPIDDIPGRIMGEQVGIDAFDVASNYFAGTITGTISRGEKKEIQVFPNPARVNQGFYVENSFNGLVGIEIIDLKGRLVKREPLQVNPKAAHFFISTQGLKAGAYVLKVIVPKHVFTSLLRVEE